MIIKITYPSRKKQFLFGSIALIGLLVPWMHLSLHSNSLGYVFEFFTKNILLSILLILAGKTGLVIGGIIAFQRVLEYSIANAVGFFAPGISRQAFVNLTNSDPSIATDFFLTAPYIIITSIVCIGIYMTVYYKISRTIWAYLKQRRALYSKEQKALLYSFLTILIILAWTQKSPNDIFFFEAKKSENAKIIDFTKTPRIVLQASQN